MKTVNILTDLIQQYLIQHKWSWGFASILTIGTDYHLKQLDFEYTMYHIVRPIYHELSNRVITPTNWFHTQIGY